MASKRVRIAHPIRGTGSPRPAEPIPTHLRAYREAPIGLCYFDTDLRYVHINDWLAAINGLTVEEHLGRTVGEVLPGVAAGVESQLRHARATAVEVGLYEQDEDLVLTVVDNGRGISPHEVFSCHSAGLIGMRERAHRFGGAVLISGAPTLLCFHSPKVNVTRPCAPLLPFPLLQSELCS